MADNEIIKALECHSNDYSLCTECPFSQRGECSCELARDALVLINRQKAEIERIHRHTEMYHEVKAESVKEFTARVKEKLHYAPTVYQSYFLRIVDATAKEMVGES